MKSTTNGTASAEARMGKSSASCIATRGRRMAIPSMRVEPGPETEDKKDDRVICRPFCPLSLKRRV